jgi:putative ABC transport system ATP-binding protein
MSELIKMKGVTKVYSLGETEVHALRGVDVKIKKGEFISIIGPSGSGKSTLMHIIGCLDRATSGSYFLQGKDVNEMDENQLADIRKEFIGFIFQDFYLLPDVPAWYNVSLPMIYDRIPPKERKKKAVSILNSVGLGDRVNHLPNQLSGGERQRVAIARSLANEPEIIIADEPTGNLDSVRGEEILKILSELHKEGKTIIIVSHEKYVAERGKRKIHLKDGMVEGKG